MQTNKQLNKYVAFLIVVLFLFVIFWVAGKENEKKDRDLENVQLEVPAGPFVVEDEYVPPAPLADPTFISSIELNKTKMLTINQKVKLDNTDDTFEITEFYNHPCPSNVACIWSGQDVYYEINIGNKIYKKSEPLQQITDLPYNIQIVESDYETYAKVIISKK